MIITFQEVQKMLKNAEFICIHAHDTSIYRLATGEKVQVAIPCSSCGGDDSDDCEVIFLD